MIKAKDLSAPKYYYVFHAAKGNQYYHVHISIRKHLPFKDNGKRTLPNYIDSEVLNLSWQGNIGESLTKAYGLHVSFEAYNAVADAMQLLRKLDISYVPIKKILHRLSALNIRRFVLSEDRGKAFSSYYVPRKYRDQSETYRTVYQSVAA